MGTGKIPRAFFEEPIGTTYRWGRHTGSISASSRSAAGRS
jgi:hypothetical protein